ncbi:MAG: transporter substrate-binding domain-containing protein [Magnetococcales bacterium]|nr:transporter substrate-binding domain-containing protein [Magnetococcales bacterium]
MKRFFFLVFSLYTLCALTVPAQAQDPEKISIQFKWFHQFQFAGYYAALEKGFYAEEGLDVDLIEYVANGDPVKEVVSGRATYGVSDAGLLLSRLNNEPVVLIAQIFQHSPVIILTLRKSNLRTPYDLAGKSVMTYLQGQGDASLKAMVRKALGAQEKVDWQEHSYRFEDVIEGRVDAMLAYSTNEPFWFHEQGEEANVIDPRDYGIDFYGDNLFTSELEAKDHPERVAKVLRATLKGWQYALDHQDEIIDLILKKYNTQNKTRPHLKFEARQTAELVDTRTFKLGHIEPSRYKKIAATYQQLLLANQQEIPPGFLWGELSPQTIKAKLNKEEQNWVSSHTVKVGVEEWRPIIFATKDGQVGGLVGGYLELLAQRTGLQFEFVSDIWETLLIGFRERTIDLLPDAFYNDERATYGLFSKPYFLSKEFIYVLSDNQKIHTMDDLANKKIAMLKSYGTTPKIKAYLPTATIVETLDILEAINAVLNKEVDALIQSQIVMYQTLRDNSITGIKGISQKIIPPSPLHFFSRIDEPILQSILQKGLDTITQEERRELQKKWLKMDTSGDRKHIDLSLDEEQWLTKHLDIRIGGDFNFPPFSFRDEQDKFSGISAGYLDVFSQRLGIKMTPMWGLSWEQVIHKVKSGDVDIIPAIVRTPERESYLNFTKPIISFPIVIATHKDTPFVGKISDLKGLKTGVVAGSAIQDILSQEHPDLSLVPFNNLEEGMIELQNKQITAFIDNLGGITFLIDQKKLSKIKIAAPTDYKFELSIGVRKDWPELVVLLDKALESIDENERKSIENTWMAVQVQFGLDIKTILIWAVPIGSAATFIIFIIVVWNRRMAQEIALRKKAEQDLLHAKHVVDDAMEIISGSIRYASRIQHSILPLARNLDKVIPNRFVIWEPRDVVGGDMYWCRPWGDGHVLMLGDCTGHGVPGAFMTLISNGAFGQAYREVEPGNPGLLLQRIHQLIQTALGQHLDKGESDDGLELGVCYIPSKGGIMLFSGARFELFVLEGEKVSIIKGTKKGTGYRGIPRDQIYQDISIELRPWQRFYMTSDGIIDQVGGKKRRGFGKRRFTELLLKSRDIPFEEQKTILLQALTDHQGSESRRDDVSIIGFSLS